MSHAPCSGQSAPGATAASAATAPCCDAHRAPGEIVAERNRYFTAQESKEFGLVDEVLSKITGEKKS